MIPPAFDRAFQAARALYADTPLRDFVSFDHAATFRGCTPFHIPAADAMWQDTTLTTPNPEWRDPFTAIWDQVTWRETYKGTDIGDDFMSRFGCYELIGHDGPYHSTAMRGFIVYMPAGLYYDWHHHPAEEMYVVLAGQAEFEMVGKDPVTAPPGTAIFHPSGVPHRTTTHAAPMLAWVSWRPPHMDIAPVLSGPQP